MQKIHQVIVPKMREDEVICRHCQGHMYITDITKRIERVDNKMNENNKEINRIRKLFAKKETHIEQLKLKYKYLKTWFNKELLKLEKKLKDFKDINILLNAQVEELGQERFKCDNPDKPIPYAMNKYKPQADEILKRWKLNKKTKQEKGNLTVKTDLNINIDGKSIQDYKLKNEMEQKKKYIRR